MKRKQVMALMLAAALTAGSFAAVPLAEPTVAEAASATDVKSVSISTSETFDADTTPNDIEKKFADSLKVTLVNGTVVSAPSISWDWRDASSRAVKDRDNADKYYLNTITRAGIQFTLKGTINKNEIDGVTVTGGSINWDSTVSDKIEVTVKVLKKGESTTTPSSNTNNSTSGSATPATGTGAASNNNGSSTNNNTTDTTPDNRETKTNADGSTTVTTTRDDGTVIAVTTSADGDLVTTVTTNPDGSKKERTVATNGNVRTVVTVSTKADGTQKVTATVKDSEESTKLVFSNSKNDGTLKLASADTGDATSITVPSSVKVGNTTYTVTKLASNAFTSNPTIEKVTIGKSIKVIGGDAFASCENLSKVVINGPVLINSEAFLYCDQLKAITFKGNVGRVSKNAFKGINKNATFTVTGDANASKARYQKIVKRVKAGNAPKTAKFKRS